MHKLFVIISFLYGKVKVIRLLTAAHGKQMKRDAMVNNQKSR